jgi:hypothetical protein
MQFSDLSFKKVKQHEQLLNMNVPCLLQIVWLEDFKNFLGRLHIQQLKWEILNNARPITRILHF